MESARLKLSESLDVPLGPPMMWSLVTDPKVVVACIPGAAITGADDEGALEGTMVTKFGPTIVRFHGTVVPEFDHGRREGRLKARGGDEAGRTKAAADISFRVSGAEGAPHAEMVVDAIIEVSGGLAPFVRMGGAHLARRMLEDFAGNLATLSGPENSAGGAEPRTTTGGQASAFPSPAKGGLRFMLQVLFNIAWDALRRLTRGGSRPTTTEDRRTP